MIIKWIIICVALVAIYIVVSSEVQKQFPDSKPLFDMFQGEADELKDDLMNLTADTTDRLQEIGKERLDSAQDRLTNLVTPGN